MSSCRGSPQNKYHSIGLSAFRVVPGSAADPNRLETLAKILQNKYSMDVCVCACAIDNLCLKKLMIIAKIR